MRMLILRLKRVAWIALLVCACQSEAAIVHFGAAEPYVMATGGYSSLLLGSAAHIEGSVAAGFYLSLGSGVTIEGSACAPALGIGAGAVIQGGTACPHAPLYEDILSGSRDLAGLPGSPLLRIDSSSTLTAGVYQVGSLLLDANEVLTIRGGIQDTVVVNVSGTAKLGSGAGIVLAGGIKSSNVYFNFINSPQYSSFEFGAAAISGNFVSDGRSFIMGDGATLGNTRFLTNGNIIANVQTVRYTPNNSVTEPGDIEAQPSDVNAPGFLPLVLTLFVLLCGAGRLGLVRR